MQLTDKERRKINSEILIMAALMKKEKSLVKWVIFKMDHFLALSYIRGNASNYESKRFKHNAVLK